MKETGDERDHRGSWRVEKKRKETGGAQGRRESAWERQSGP